jgi:predicted alpha/beta hydrolase family esterase
MTNALILHGKPSKESYLNPDRPSPSNDIWLPWLQKQLLLLGIPTQTPEMLNAWQPDYRIWSREFERHDLTEDTLLVGHSMGAGFLVQWLSAHPEQSIGHVFLIAPSLGDRFTPEHKLDHPVLGGFFDFMVDPALLTRTKSLTLFHSDNDMARVVASVQHIRQELPGIEYREFHNYGHFCGKRDMGSDTFPELLEAISGKMAVK